MSAASTTTPDERAKTALLTAQEAQAIRRDERRKLGQLLTENAEVIATYAKDAESAVLVVALMLELDGAR